MQIQDQFIVLMLFTISSVCDTFRNPSFLKIIIHLLLRYHSFFVLLLLPWLTFGWWLLGWWPFIYLIINVKVLKAQSFWLSLHSFIHKVISPRLLVLNTLCSLTIYIYYITHTYTYTGSLNLSSEFQTHIELPITYFA